MNPHGAIWRIVSVAIVMGLIGCPSILIQSEAANEVMTNRLSHRLFEPLQVTKQAWNGSEWSDILRCYVGDIIRFNITLEHVGTTVILYDFIIHDNLPGFLRYHGNPTLNGHQVETYKIKDSYVEWNILQHEFSLSPGQRAYLEFDTIVVGSGNAINEIVVVADYSGSENEFVIASDSMTLSVYPFDRPSLSVTKKVWMDSKWVSNCYVNEFPVDLWFSCTVENTGGHDLKNLGLQDVLGDGLVNPRDFSANPETITVSSVTWKSDQSLAPGQHWSVQFIATATAPTINSVTSTADATQDNIPLFDTASLPIKYLSTNIQPLVTEMYPLNNAADLSLGTTNNITLQVKVVDGNNDLVTVSFYNASSQGLISRIEDVDTDYLITTQWHSLAYDSTYHWYVTVTDGYLTTTSQLFQFTTGSKPTNHAPNKPLLLHPLNNSKNIPLTVPLQVNVTHPDHRPMTVLFYNGSNHKLIGSVGNIASGKVATVTWLGLTHGTTYTWYCRVIDDSNLQTTSPLWYFTTVRKNTPPSIQNIAPENYAVVDTLTPTLKVYVLDPDEDILTVHFYDASTHSLLGSNSHAKNDSTVSFPWDDIDYASSYSWYAVVNDSLTQRQSPQWHFTTPPMDVSCYIKGGMGVNAIIQNTGIVEAADLNLALTIEGGILNRVHMSASTIIDSLEPGRAVTAKQFPFGLGGITVTLDISSRGNHIQKTARGLITGLRVRIL